MGARRGKAPLPPPASPGRPHSCGIATRGAVWRRFHSGCEPATATAAPAAAACADVGQTPRKPYQPCTACPAAGLTLPGLCSTFGCSLDEAAAAAHGPLPSADQQ